MPSRSGISNRDITIFKTPSTNRLGDRFPQPNGVRTILCEALIEHPN